MRALRDERCQFPSKPTHNVSTFSASRPKATFTIHRACFVPATLLSFFLQGFVPYSNPKLSPDSILPCRSRIQASSSTFDFEGLLLLQSRLSIPTVSSRDQKSYPPGFSPLRFSLSPPWNPVSRLPPSTSFTRYRNRGSEICVGSLKYRQ